MTNVRQDSLTELCARENVSLDYDSVSQVVMMTKNGVQAKGIVGSASVLIDDDRVTLSAPIKRVDGALIVPADFERKVFDCFGESRQDYRISKLREIIIDAGHGGKDPGARGKSGILEKTVVLDISKRLKDIMEQKGVNVIMTRDKDEYLTLKERTEIASRSNADLFVSIHANSSKSRNAKGFEVYYLRDLMAHEKKDADLQDNHRIKYRNFEMDENAEHVENIVADMMYTYKQGESKHLADMMSKRASDSIDAESRGSKSCAFFVLRNTLIPAVLVEVGFLTNQKEERLLKTDEYRQKIANALAKNILDYVNRD